MITKTQNLESIFPEAGYLVTYEQMNTLITFQKLWTELSAWLRSLLITISEDLESSEAVTRQLYTIPSEFYNIFRVFYGPVIAQQFLNMLTSFIAHARSLFEALKSGDNEVVNQNVTQLYQIADNMAAFLSRINVYWDEDQWKYLLEQFVRFLIDEAIAQLSDNYEQEILIFNRLDDLTDIIGSYMARGIIARATGGPVPQAPAPVSPTPTPSPTGG